MEDSGTQRIGPVLCCLHVRKLDNYELNKIIMN